MTLGALILRLLRVHGPLSLPEIQQHVATTAFSPISVPTCLTRLKRAGRVAHLSSGPYYSLWGLSQ